MRVPMDPSTMKVDELKKELARRGLSATGLKADLVKCVSQLFSRVALRPSPASLFPFPQAFERGA